jgi:sporulation protein YlmC with PRC-barrel domain
MGVVEETQVVKKTTFLPATEIKGSRVVNVKEENLGKIEEVMIDSERGRIAYAVIAFDCFLGMDCKLFAVPWGALEENRGDYILRVDKGALEAAEGLNEDVWALTRNDLAKVYEQYKLHPYWEL